MRPPASSPPTVSTPRSRRPLSVQACDGCCCGTARKHPGVDHAEQRERLQAAARHGGGRYRTVGCLDVCHASNVVVVRRPDGKRVWFGRVLDAATLDALCDWIGRGAPPELPDRLTAHAFEPSAAPVQLTARL